MKPFHEETINLLSSVVLEDEFDDADQKGKIYGGQTEGLETLNKLLDYPFSVSHPEILHVGAGSGGADLNLPKGTVEYFLEPNESRASVNPGKIRIPGWCENILNFETFDAIVCWNTICFVRSLPETLVQFNNRLQIAGHLIVDVVKSTILPIAQTVDPDSFVRYAEVFGFSLEHRIPCGQPTHKKEGFRFRKFRDFDPRYLRVAQFSGTPRNFLYERDWFLV